MILRLLLIILLTACGRLALAADMPASQPAPKSSIAMHDAPKYAPDFAHFDYVNPDAPKGGTLRQGITGSFDSLNPFIIRGRPAAGLSYLYDSLMARGQDEPFSLYGLIAESIAVPDDRSSATFTLRKEARWHDGTPITVDDVLYSWQNLRDKGRPNHRTYYKKVALAEKIGDRQIRFVFKPETDGTIDREMPLIIGLMPIIPKHFWEKHVFDATTLTPPLGGGPYKIAEVDPGRSITYERVKDYWAKDLPALRGLYNFDMLRFDYYRDDGIALEAFKAGQYDLRRELDPTRWAAGYEGPALRDGKIVMEEIPHHRVEAVRAFSFNLRKPLFQDRALRAAIALAFDFDWINRTLFHAAYTRTQSYFANSELAATGLPDANEMKWLESYRNSLPSEFFTTRAEDLVPDDTDSGRRAKLREATNLLRDAGYELRDGKLFTRQGAPVRFEIMLNDPADEKVALEFGRSLRRLGITLDVRTVDSAQYQARLNDFNYDMAAVRWVNSLSPGNEQIYYWGSAAADQKGSRNYPGIKNPAIDAIARAIPATATRADLIGATRALDRLLLWGHYTVPLSYLRTDHVAHAATLRRPSAVPLYGFVLESWWQVPVSEAGPRK